jgi:hypothetical protein
VVLLGMRARYPRALRAVLGAAAAPAGYTITTWGAGAVLLSAQGVPSLSESLSYVAGAALALAALRATGGSPPSAPDQAPVDAVAGFHAFSASVAVGGAAGVAGVIEGPPAWAIAAASATLTFFVISALGLALVDAAG